MINQQVTPWLPKSTLTGDNCRAIIQQCVADWGEKWFVSGRLCSARFQHAPERLPHHRNLEIGPGLSLSCPADSRLELTSQLLSRPLTQRHIRTVQDLAIIDRLVDEALSSLGASLKDLWRKPLESDETERFSMSVEVEKAGPLVWLSISAARLGALLRKNAPPPRPQLPAGRPDAAIADQQIEIGGFLGSTRLSLSDIERLETGDVIVLDEKTSTPIGLTINGVSRVDEAATIQPLEETLSLTLQKSIEQW